MDIWLIQDGEKTGPFHDYEIRRKIGTGDLGASTPAWHEGLPGWTTLSEISLFSSEFEIIKPVEEEPSLAPVPPPLPNFTTNTPSRPHIVRRFWARCFDLFLYTSIWWLLMWFTGRNIEGLYTSLFVSITQLIPWFIIESLLIHRFATTPGKWLMGIKVLNQDGSLLTLAQAGYRSMRVLLVGIGFGLPLVSIFCMALSAFTTRRIGATVWDHMGKHRLITSPLSAWKVLCLILLMFTAIQLQFGVTGPVIMKLALQDLNTEESKPLREFLEKNPPLWSLPRRDQ